MSGKRFKKLTTKKRLIKRFKKDPVFQLRRKLAVLEGYRPLRMIEIMFGLKI